MTKKEKQALWSRRYQLKTAYKKWEKKKIAKEAELNKKKLDTMVYYNNKLAEIANRIEEFTFRLNEL